MTCTRASSGKPAPSLRAKRSNPATAVVSAAVTGLPRRCAPRNDEARRASSLQPLDLLRRLVEDGGDFVQPRLVRVVGGDPVPPRREQIAHRALDRPAAGAALALAGSGQPLEQSLDLLGALGEMRLALGGDRKSTRLNSSHLVISYAVFCFKKNKNTSSY